MTAPAFTLLALAAALGSGLIAGVFFAFSAFVMRALARRPAAEGMAAMQAINVAVINPLFMLVFLGTALLCGVLAGLALFGQVPGSLALWSGCALYLIGCFGVTMACNVPLNNRLAATAPGTAAGDAVWRDYLRRWQRWNHLRTVASLAASASFTLAA